MITSSIGPSWTGLTRFLSTIPLRKLRINNRAYKWRMPVLTTWPQTQGRLASQRMQRPKPKLGHLTDNNNSLRTMMRAPWLKKMRKLKTMMPNRRVTTANKIRRKKRKKKRKIARNLSKRRVKAIQRTRTTTMTTISLALASRMTMRKRR